MADASRSEVPHDDARQPFFNPDNGALRFWVDVGDGCMGATISQQALHYRFDADLSGNDAVAVYRAHRPEIDAAVRRRVASGSIEPVMQRESDVSV